MIGNQVALSAAKHSIDGGPQTTSDTLEVLNPPFDPNPAVLFLALLDPGRDEACVREHFPGRKWYRSGSTERLDPF